jgi:hypothetical protein
MCIYILECSIYIYTYSLVLGFSLLLSATPVELLCRVWIHLQLTGYFSVFLAKIG